MQQSNWFDVRLAAAVIASVAVQVSAQSVANELRPGSARGPDQQEVSKANKASSLLGMEVRNSQNEKLGEIKDLVLDVPSGKVSYAVLSVGGFLGIGDKYIAVPPSAFSIPPEKNVLLLNADKVKIQNAPGFVKTNWPNIKSPAWGAETAYWLTGDSARGSPGGTLSGSATARSERPESTGPEVQSFQGTILALDREAKTMAVRGAQEVREFRFTAQPKVTLRSQRSGGVADLKTGLPVIVNFHKAEGKYVADEVTKLDTPEVK